MIKERKDMGFGVLNIRSLYKLGVLKAELRELITCSPKLDLEAVGQKVRWKIN
jgi:hypothetical protein